MRTKSVYPMNINRRHFLRALGASGALLGAIPNVWSAQSGDGNGSNFAANSAFVPDLEIELVATHGEVTLLPGAATHVWRFQGRVLKGESDRFQMLPPGLLPLIRVHRGQNVRIHFFNDLHENSIIHWHGLHIVQKMDGHPMHAIAPGRRFVYEFTVNNRAGTYWFHPHPHGRTGEQVYRGLAGLLLVSDDEEKGAGLPRGEFDLAWVIQDRRFSNQNQLLYLQSMMEQMNGFLGDRLLINGQPDFIQRVASAAYRVRLLNGSNSRIYRLAWSDGRPLTVIGTDGGLLQRPLQRPYVTLAPAERLELWMDFSDRNVGAEATLISLPFNSGAGMMRGPAAPGGGPFAVVKVRVDRKIVKPHALPRTLSNMSRYRLDEAVNRNMPRIFRPMMGMRRAAINGRSFEMTRATPDETVRLDTVEVWEFANDAGMMTMAHPMHVHNLQFQVLERRMDFRYPFGGYAADAGFLDEGWKDVVLVMPGERVKVLMKFTDYTGLYLYHCHILEHEDMGMMRNYLVQA